MSPHLEELFPDMLTLLTGLAQGSFMVERGGLVGAFRHVLNSPSQLRCSTLYRKTLFYKVDAAHRWCL